MRFHSGGSCAVVRFNALLTHPIIWTVSGLGSAQGSRACRFRMLSAYSPPAPYQGSQNNQEKTIKCTSVRIYSSEMAATASKPIRNCFRPVQNRLGILWVRSQHMDLVTQSHCTQSGCSLTYHL